MTGSTGCLGATTTVYVTDADNREVLEYSGAGALQTWYAFGLGPTMRSVTSASPTLPHAAPTGD